jgi:hypothetical protein
MSEDGFLGGILWGFAFVGAITVVASIIIVAHAIVRYMGY